MMYKVKGLLRRNEELTNQPGLLFSSPTTLLRASLSHPGNEALASSSAQPGCKDELRSGGL
jgi:hypothetical protein